MRIICKSLLVVALGACGSPQSDSVFKGKEARTEAPKAAPRPAVAPSQVPTDVRVYRGFYRKFEDESSFMPCGTSRLIEVTGTLVARGILKERFRWFASNEGDRMYGVFRGAMVVDTPKVVAANGDSTRGGPRTRFFLVDVDSFRTWRNSDCNGMKVPWPGYP